jgi:hypothetical protein
MFIIMTKIESHTSSLDSWIQENCGIYPQTEEKKIINLISTLPASTMHNELSMMNGHTLSELKEKGTPEKH